MGQKNTIIFYHDWLILINSLPDEKRLKFYDLIFSENDFSILKIDDAHLKSVVDYVGNQIKSNNNKYIEKCEKLRNNAMLGAKKQKHAIASKSKQMVKNAQQLPYDNDTDNDNDINKNNNNKLLLQKMPFVILPEEWKKWAMNKFNWNEEIIQDTWQLFFEYWVNGKGKNTKREKWGATWRMWCTKQSSQIKINNWKNYEKPKEKKEGVITVTNENLEQLRSRELFQ